MKKIFTFLFFITSINLAKAQTTFTATYSFSNVTTSSGTVDPTPSPTVSGLTCGSFVAVGLNANSSTAGVFDFGAWSNTTAVFNATTAAQYYQVTLTAATGSLVSLNTLTFAAQRSSGTAPRQWTVRSSIDNYTTNLSVASAANATIVSSNTFSNNVNTNSAACTITPSSSITFSNGGSVTFRFYAWEGNSGPRLSIDNVSFSGSVTAPPVAPSSLTAVYQATLSNDLTWVDNSNNETGFELWYSVNSGTYSLLTNTIAANATSYTHTGLSYGTNYCYEIRAVNAAGSSAFSNTACVSTPSTPIAPSSLTAVYQATLSNDLTWVDNSNNETGFELWYSVNSGTYSLLTNTIAANATSYTHTGLSYGTNYCYEIRAVNAAGSSAFSNTACVSTPSTPIAPSSLTAVYQATLSNDLTWVDNSSDETGFELWYSVNSGTYSLLTNTIASNATSYTHTGLSYGTNYCYEIRAVNAAGNSAFSNTACVSTPTTPPVLGHYYYYTNEGTNSILTNPNNWRIGAFLPFSANSTGTMTTPAAFPSINDTIVFDNDASVFGENVSYCDLFTGLSGSLSVSGIIIGNYTGGEVDASGLSLFHTDTMSIDGSGGTIYFDAPNSGTIDVTKNIYVSNFPLIGSGATLQLSGSTTQTISGTGFSVAALKITGTGSKILSAPITILDNVDVGTATLSTNGNLTLAADASTTARIAKIGTGGSISGNVTAWTYAPGPNTGWALLGCNGLNGATVNNWNTGGSYSGGQQIPMTCTNCVYSPTTTMGFTSIQGWDEAATTLTTAYITTLTTSTALSPGKGFWVYVGDGFTTTNDITYSLSGTVVQGSTTTPITRTVASPTNVIGWNLVANPYASPLTTSSVTTANSSILNSAAVYLWNADNNTYTTNPSVIPAGQGFYVEALSASASFSFNEGMKSSANTSPLLKTTGTSSTGGFVLSIYDTYGSHDETEIGINADATLGYDHLYDAHKLYSTPNYYGYTGIYTQYTSIATLLPDNSGNDICYLNTLPELTDSIVVPVLAKASVSGSYTIGINKANVISNAKKLPTCVMLKDKVTGLYHDLKMSDYVFTMADTTSAPRFELLLCRDNVDVSVKELNASNTIFITQDENGAIVKIHFEQSTKATISVFNIMGQQLIKDQTVMGTETTTHLDLDTKNQVLIIRVNTDKECVTKKMVLR